MLLQIINEEIEDYSKSIIVYKLTPTDLFSLFDILDGNIIYPDSRSRNVYGDQYFNIIFWNGSVFCQVRLYLVSRMRQKVKNK